MKNNFKRLSMALFALFIMVSLSGCGAVQGKDGQINKIDGGIWDTVFVKPVSLVLDFITTNSDKIFGKESFAVGIIITTIIVRTILFPVYTKTNNTSTKMQEIQPELKKIQDKYANKQDPESRQRMQMELMQVYKDNNVNMLAGCFMPFLQMPVFMAMYHAVARTPVTYGYVDNPEKLEFLWVSLNQVDKTYILPIIVALTAVLLQYITMYGMSPEAKNNPTMKMMMYIMPGMMLVFSISQVSALSLYWIAGNIYSTLQTIFVKKPFKKVK
jgi:YidC/Oxa1 family membrane protein insertase